jgi:hypothetical protein
VDEVISLSPKTLNLISTLAHWHPEGSGLTLAHWHISTLAH